MRFSAKPFERCKCGEKGLTIAPGSRKGLHVFLVLIKSYFSSQIDNVVIDENDSHHTGAAQRRRTLFEWLTAHIVAGRPHRRA